MRIVHGLLPGHVLQRQRGGGRATIRGLCRASGPVVAEVRPAGGRCLSGWSGRVVGRARGGSFAARLQGLPVGGPYRVTLRCGDAAVEVPDVFVGDLWLMAGQSNMEGYSNLPGSARPHPLIRCFTMARRWELAREPLHLQMESPDPVHGGQSLSPEAAARTRRRARKGGGVGLHFARLMFERTGVPQGLIATAHGGSSMQQWDPGLRARGGHSLYGSMLLSLRDVAQPLAGMLWYQGESEALPALAPVYTRQMRRLVAAVRRDVGQPDLPWLMVQIGRFIIGGYHDKNGWPDAASWHCIQEQQRRLPDLIGHCAVVPAIDLELEDLAHLASDANPILAGRLAEIAALLAHRDNRARPPIAVQSVCFASAPGPCLTVSFAHVAGALHSAGPVRGFMLVDADGRTFPAIRRVCVQGRRVILHLSTAEIAGMRLQYGDGFDPSCTLMDRRGMAVPVFGPLQITTPQPKKAPRMKTPRG